MKKFIILSLMMFVAVFALFPKTVEAKLWSKELVEKVILTSGYRFEICSINLEPADIISNFGVTQSEESFSENSKDYKCVGKREDLIFGYTDLYFNKQNYPDVPSQPAKEQLIVFRDKMYSIQGSGGEIPSGLISQNDDFFVTHTGLKYVKRVGIYPTDPKDFNPNLLDNTIKDSSITISYAEGNFENLLFVYKGQVYKSIAIAKSINQPTTLVDYTKTSVENPSPTPIIQKSSTPTPTKTVTPILRTPNPPIMNISYPSEAQFISMTQSQTFCVVDVPAGGNEEGLQRRQNINDAGWTAYSNTYTLCFDPKEGLNRFQLQYQNKYGDESAQYTRQFNFHRLSDINISLSGTFYEDKNCNLVRDTDENGINASANVQIIDSNNSILTNINTSNGYYNYSSKINENDSVTLWPQTYNVSGYSFKAHYQAPKTTLNASNKSATIDIPMVPDAYVDACSN